MDAFLVSVEQTAPNTFQACFSNGANVELGASTYMDAVLEADLLDETDIYTA